MPATASAFFTGENKNTVTFTINCGEFGTFTGSLPGGSNGSALHLEGGGVAIAQGLTELDGTVLVPVKPGLERGRESSFRAGSPSRVSQSGSRTSSPSRLTHSETRRGHELSLGRPRRYERPRRPSLLAGALAVLASTRETRRSLSRSPQGGCRSQKQGRIRADALIPDVTLRSPAPPVRQGFLVRAMANVALHLRWAG
jgi:hypothetical protein